MNQCDRVLRILRAAGRDGILTAELNRLGLMQIPAICNADRRARELREKGYNIETKRVKGKTYKMTLKERIQ